MEEGKLCADYTADEGINLDSEVVRQESFLSWIIEFAAGYL